MSLCKIHIKIILKSDNERYIEHKEAAKSYSWLELFNSRSVNEEYIFYITD